MTKTLPVVQDAENLFCQGDVDGFLALFDEKAQFFIPGRTPLSGEHDCTTVRPHLERMAMAVRSGDYKPEVICRYGGQGGALSVLDNHVLVDGQSMKYHSVHEWLLRDGRLVVLLVYLHEYDIFEAAWK